MSSILFRCLVALMPVFGGASSAFLHRSQYALTAEQKSVVLAVIEDALGDKHRHATEVRLAPIETLLAPTLNALPKNEHGRFGHKAARYALHRLFVQRHAWFVKGIVHGDLGNANATPADMLQGGVPEVVQSLFEARLGSHGLDAHEVAVMAATLENLAHAESMERLRLACKVKGLSPGAASISSEEVEGLLDVYMAAYVTGLNLTDVVTKKQGADFVLDVAETTYPGFADVRSFVRQVITESASGRNIFSSVDVSNIVTRIGDKYGRWQHHECDDLKRKLFSIEDDGTGRVSLSKFYDSALNQGQWQFTEAPDYLRSLGALDESNPSNPRVIVSNYILAPSNCVASSSYYSVCCLDECEEFVGHLEREIQAPAATPAQIARLVAAMPSSAGAKPTISASLLGRLDEVAAGNDGMIPLHGRMFAQWMHHVYPRECPYPHLSGTTKPLRTEEYETKTGLDTTASIEEMRKHIAEAVHAPGSGELTWSHDDELYVERAPPRVSSLWSILRFVVFFVLAISTAGFLLRLSREGDTAAIGQAFSKAHYV